MKKKFCNILWLLILTQFFCATFAAKNLKQQAVFQVATIGSLTQGVYDGSYDYGHLKHHGNFGVGTFLDLDGEMVAIEGDFYQIKSNGKLKKVTSNQIVPFAEVTFFKPVFFKNLSDIFNYHNLGNQLSSMITNKNIPYAIRIDGLFSSLKLRSLRKQKKPYPPLTQASSEQAIFNLNNVKGSIVGFWFPSYWAGIAVPGYHLHFITQDRTTGGHVLEIDLSKGKVSIEPLNQVEVYLPHINSFARANLSEKELHSAIEKAEGGTQ